MTTRRSFLIQTAAFGAGTFIPQSLLAIDKDMRLFTWVERSQPLMGTYLTLAVWSDAPQEQQTVLTDCFAHLSKCIDIISSWNSESETSQLNQTRVLQASNCSPVFLSFIQQALEVQRLCGPSFSPVCKGITSLWKQARLESLAPDGASIRTELKRIRTSRLLFDRDECAIKGEAEIDCGGFGKGLIADLARDFLLARKVKIARIDCGGDLRFLGETKWSVDVMHPRQEALLGRCELQGDCAIATSGDYQQAWEVHGQRYHHLIDLQSGYPGANCQSVTVCASTATIADALSTAVFFMPAEQGRTYLDRLPGVEGLIVDGGGRLLKTSRLHISKGVFA